MTRLKELFYKYQTIIVIGFVVGLSILLSVLYDLPDEGSSLYVAREQKKVVTTITRQLIYFKDLRTNTCFAYYGERYRGSTLATVLCENVPNELLYQVDLSCKTCQKPGDPL